MEQQVDVILMATENRLERGRVTIGDSVAYVFRHAPCEVIVVRTAPPKPDEKE